MKVLIELDITTELDMDTLIRRFANVVAHSTALESLRDGAANFVSGIKFLGVTPDEPVIGGGDYWLVEYDLSDNGDEEEHFSKKIYATTAEEAVWDAFWYDPAGSDMIFRIGEHGCVTVAVPAKAIKSKLAKLPLTPIAPDWANQDDSFDTDGNWHVYCDLWRANGDKHYTNLNVQRIETGS